VNTGETVAHVLFAAGEIIAITLLIAIVAATLFVDYTNQKKVRDRQL
jgi:hypothetical protein